MIGRIWHGWTKPENADAYETLLKEEIFPGIADKEVPGYRGIQLFRGPLEGGEVEFVTIMRFDSWEAVKRFSGEDYERAYVPQKAREVLARFDERSRHYEIREKPRVPALMADLAMPAVASLPREALSRRSDKRLPMHDLIDIEAWPRRREELLREAENRRTIRPPEVVRPGESRRFGSIMLERAHARLPWRKGMAKC